MFRICDATVGAFEKTAIKQFVDAMVVHFQRFFPEQCILLGLEGTREAIRGGLRRANAQGIVTERDVCLFLGLEFLLGSGFADGSTHPWASAILADVKEGSMTVRLNRIYDDLAASESARKEHEAMQ